MVNKILSLVVSSVVVLWGTSAFAGPGLVLQGLELNGPGLVLQGLELNGPGLVLQGLPTNGFAFNALIDKGIKLNGTADVQVPKQVLSDEKQIAQLMQRTELSAEIVKLP